VNALTRMGLRIAPVLIDAMGDDHPEVRRGAGHALHKLGPATVPFLIRALKHEKADVRERAARGLYDLAPHAQKAIPALTEALNDTDPFVRQWAVVAVGDLGYHFGPVLKVAVPGLAALLKDEDFTVREWAAMALGSIGAAAHAAIPALREAANGEDEWLKKAAVSSLREIERAR
jgi:HEAT repeat protein